MPDENPTKEERDLKEGEDKKPSDSGQSDKKEDEKGGEGEGETVTIKKSEFDKIKSDRDNYKNIGLKKKADDRESKRKEQDDQKNGDEDKGDGTINQDKGEKSFNEKSLQSNQNRARRKFLGSHKEFIDDSLWNDFMSDYRSNSNDVTIEDFNDRLEETHILYLRRTGKLEQHLASERERGRQEGKTEAEAGSGRQAGGVGDKSEGQPSGQLSEKGKEIAKGVKLDPEKVEKVDPSKDNVIQV